LNVTNFAVLLDKRLFRDVLFPCNSAKEGSYCWHKLRPSRNESLFFKGTTTGHPVSVNPNQQRKPAPPLLYFTGKRPVRKYFGVAIIGAGLTVFCACLRPTRAKSLRLEDADAEAAVDVQDSLVPMHEPEQLGG
jgi:hypothetical protein